MSSTPPDRLIPPAQASREGKTDSKTEQTLLGISGTDNSAASEPGAKSGPRKTFGVLSPFAHDRLELIEEQSEEGSKAGQTSRRGSNNQTGSNNQRGVPNHDLLAFDKIDNYSDSIGSNQSSESSNWRRMGGQEIQASDLQNSNFSDSLKPSKTVNLENMTGSNKSQLNTGLRNNSFSSSGSSNRRKKRSETNLPNIGVKRIKQRERRGSAVVLSNTNFLNKTKRHEKIIETGEQRNKSDLDFAKAADNSSGQQTIRTGRTGRHGHTGSEKSNSNLRIKSSSTDDGNVGVDGPPKRSIMKKQQLHKKSPAHSNDQKVNFQGFGSDGRFLNEDQKMQRKLDFFLDEDPTMTKAEQLQRHLEEKSDSIEAEIQDIDPDEAPTIRSYLQRKINHDKRSELIYYSDTVIKDYKQIKSVLSRRTQFNASKQEFHYQLQKRFPLSDVNVQSLFNKETVEKSKRKNSSAAGGYINTYDAPKKKDEKLNCFQRLNRVYEEYVYTIKDDVTFKVHQNQYIDPMKTKKILPYRFARNSLGFLSNRSRLRIIVVWIITWKGFDRFILILIVLNSIGLGLKDYLDPENLTERNKFIDSFEIYFTVAFCMECSLKIIGMGFIMGKGAYLKEAWNWLDFIVVVSSLLEAYLNNLSGLRTLRLFRPLRTLNNVKSMQVLVETLFSSMMALGGIMGLAVFFFTIFAILGISQWRGLSHYRCRLTEFPVDGDWLPVPDDTQLCQPGIRDCPVGWCGSLIERSDEVGDIWAVEDLYRDTKILDLNYGVTNFDNLGSAFITIFQCITMEGWTSVMYIYQDVANSAFVVFYFMSCVIICSFFLLNLTIAVMLMEYDELEQKNSNSVHKKQLREMGKHAGVPVPLVEFVITQSNLTIGKKAKEITKSQQGEEKTCCQKLLIAEYIPEHKQFGYYSHRIPRIFYAVAKSNAFGIVVMACIMLNTLVLSLDRYPEAPQVEKDILDVCNFIFNLVFSAEVMIKLVGLGFKKYVSNLENMFDFFVVAMSWVEMAMGAEGGSSLGALRAVRLFRVFKLFKSGDLRILMDSIVFTISTIGPYTVLLCLFLYVFALSGMQFFAGAFRFADEGAGPPDKVNGVVPRANFDTFPDALLTTFSCFIGDNWTFVMYDATRTSGGYYAVFFVLVIAFGNIVMLNLFLAILLGNFDKARDFGAKMKFFNFFIDLQEIGHDLSECIDYILPDVEEYVKVRLLKWDKRMLEIEKENPSSFIRDMLVNKANFMEKYNYEFDHQISDESDSDNNDLEIFQKTSRSMEQHGSVITSTNAFIDRTKPAIAVEELKKSESTTQQEKVKDSTMDEHNFTKRKSDEDDSARMPLNNEDEEQDDTFKLLKINQLFSNDDKELQSVEEEFKEVDMDLNVLGVITGNAIKKDEFKDFKSSVGDELFKSLPDEDLQEKKKFSLIGSFRSLFKKPKKNLSTVLQRAEKKQEIEPRQVLKPSPKVVARSRETQTLAQIIEDSRLYIATDDKYYQHQWESEHAETERGLRAAGSLQTPDVRTPLGRKSQFSENYSFSQKMQSSQRKSQRDQKRHRLGSMKSMVYNSGQKADAPDVSQRPSARSRRSRTQKMMLSFFAKQENIIEAEQEPVEFMEERRCCQGFCTKAYWKRQKKYFAESSCFLFHRDSKIRKFCLQFLIDPKKQNKKGKDGSVQDGSFALQQQQTIVEGNGTQTQKIQNSSPSPKNKTQQAQRKQEPTSSAKKKSKRDETPRENKNISFQDNVSKLKKSVAEAATGRDKDKIEVNSSINKGKLSLLVKSKPMKKRGRCGRCIMRYCPSILTATANKWFDSVILFLIFTSSVMLALDTPLVDPNSMQFKVYSVIDLIHTVLFTIEMLIKIIGLGFFSNSLNNKQVPAYLRSTWNCLDFFVVMSSLAEIIAPLLMGGNGVESLKSLKALRALRALRPLRMVSKNEGMKLVVGALMTSIPSMTHVLIVCMLLLLILAIVGVNLFKGKFYSCMGLETAETELIDGKIDCLEAGGVWENQEVNFDNVLNAMMCLFQMMTTEGWGGVMFMGIDARGVDLQPKQNTSPLMALYFVAFMIIGSQFIINLFVGVVIDNFNKIKEKDEMGNNFVTQDQRSWIELNKVCLRKNLIRAISQPKGYQKVFTEITEHPIFEYTITGCILLNTIAMALVHYRQSEGFSFALEILNYFFAAIFNLEMILKLLAQGRNYFRQGWNVFDCFIVAGTNFGLLMKFLKAGESMGATTSVIRGFRIMRIFRLVKASIAIRLLIDTILNILPQISNIMSLMGILLFIYAALGLNLFSQVMFQDQLNEKNNFRNFGNAMILLMRCATGEDWNVIMYELANTTGYDGEPCREQTYEEQQRDGIMGCGSPISFVYCFSFVVIITMLIINLSVAAVIQGLDTARSENCGIVCSDDVDHFIELWKYYDPQAKGWIGAENLIYLLVELKWPLGRKKDAQLDMQKTQEDIANMQNCMADRYLVQKHKKIVIKKVEGLNMLKDNIDIKMVEDEAYQGGYKVHYEVVLKQLIERILKEKDRDYKVKGELKAKLDSMWNKKHKDPMSEDLQKTDYSAAELQAIKIIQTWYSKKQRDFEAQPEKKKQDEKDVEKFKEAQKELADKRRELSKVSMKVSSSRSNDKKQLMTTESERHKSAARQFAEEQSIEGGMEILECISKQTRKEQGPKKEQLPVRQYRYQGSHKLKRQKPPNMGQSDNFTWISNGEKLQREVEEEEKLRDALKLRSWYSLSEESYNSSSSVEMDRDLSQRTDIRQQSKLLEVTQIGALDYEPRGRANSAAEDLDRTDGIDEFGKRARSFQDLGTEKVSAKINNFTLNEQDQKSKPQINVYAGEGSSFDAKTSPRHAEAEEGKEVGQGLFTEQEEQKK